MRKVENNTCETPIHQIIEAATESKENRDRLVKTFCVCAIIMSIFAGLGLFNGVGMYVHDYINEKRIKNEPTE